MFFEFKTLNLNFLLLEVKIAAVDKFWFINLKYKLWIKIKA